MRTKKTLVNIAAGSLCHIFTIVMTFWAKRVFVIHIGFELLGLVNVFTSLVVMLGLSELGLGTAATQALYRPIAEGDDAAVAAITKYCGGLYKKISAVVLALGAAGLPFLTLLIQGDYGFSYLASLYIPFVVSASLSYWAAHRKNLLLADQKGYIVSWIQLGFRLAASLAQVIIIIRFGDYRYYLYVKIAFELMENLAAYAACAKRYPFLKTRPYGISGHDKKYLSSNVRDLAFHRIGSYLITGTDNLVISVFLGERIVAFCSGSALVINTVTDFLGQLFSSVSSGVGNLIAIEDEAHVLNVFRRIFMAQHFLVSFSCVSLYVLLDPFIRIWMGPEAVLPWLAKATLVLNFYLTVVSQPVGTLRASAGVFRPDRYLHVALAALNVILSVALVKPLGVAGVYLGTLACLLVKEVATLPNIVDRHILGGFSGFYYPALAGYAALTALEVLVSAWIASRFMMENQYIRFASKAALCVFLPNAVNLLAFYRTKSFKALRGTMKDMLSSLLRKLTGMYKKQPPHARQSAFAAAAAILAFAVYLAYAFVFLRPHFVYCLAFSGGLLLLAALFGCACMRRFPEDSLVTALIRCRYAVCLALFVYFVAWGAHGLSLGAWDAYFSNAPGAPEAVMLFGSPNSVTSDVWGILVPQFISQAEKAFPLYNTALMSSGANAVLHGLPAKDLAMLGRPCLWGFFFLDTGRALAWMYWSRLFGLLLSGYEVISRLTGGNRKLSALGGLLLAFGSITQWWAGHVLPEVLLYGQCIITLLSTYVGNIEKPAVKCACTALFAIFSLGFAVTLSPALQVSVGYMAALFCAGILWESRERIKAHFTRADALSAALSILFISAILLRFFYNSREDIALILATEYPGIRVSSGGGYGISKFFYYIYQWFLPFSSALPPDNNCEASMFLPFLPAVFLAFPLVRRNDKKKGLVPVLIYAYTAFCAVWLFVPFPEAFAKVTLFSFVTDKRILWALGAASIYLGMYCLSVPAGRLWKKTKTPAVIAGAFTLLFLVATIIYRDSLDIFNRFSFLGAGVPAIIKISAVSFTLAAWFVFMFFFFRGNRKICGALLCALILLCGFTVNPLSVGADAITSKQVVIDVRRIGQEEPDALWLYNGDFPKSLILTASGVRSFTAVNLYPDWEKWRVLDPKGAFTEIYNRYAHVSVSITEGVTSFGLDAEDAIRVGLTYEDMLRLGVRYIVSEEDLSGKIPGVKEVLKNEADGLWIYLCP